jgi:hypothetical protein
MREGEPLILTRTVAIIGAFVLLAQCSPKAADDIAPAASSMRSGTTRSR